jgi:hypothetical protein
MSERDNMPRWDGRPGRYEVWFLTMSSLDGRLGYWIRYTLRAPTGGAVEPELWFARFDRRTPDRTFGIHGPAGGGLSGADGSGGFRLSVGDAVIESGAARGALSGAGHDVRWDLKWPTGEPTVRLLPAPLYRGGLAPTRPVVPNPDVRFTGTIEVDGQTVDLDGFPGQQGHVEGTRHAERWAWASSTDFGEEGFAFQAVSAQSRRGPFLTPFATFAALRLDDRWIPFRALARRRTWGLGWWRLRLVSRLYRLEGEVRAAPSEMLRARYRDPDGTPRWVHNSEVASSRLLLWERRAGGWQEVADLSSDGTTHAEWAGTTPATAVEREHVEVA